MFEQEYSVTLLSDVVVTADAATVGGHFGLDHLPGSLFLGAAVARALRDGSGFDPLFFLSGRVRFLDAFPAANADPTFPVPFCYHQIKGDSWEGQFPCNMLLGSGPGDGKQIQQWRGGYMSADGQVVKVEMESRLKTAIDRFTRRSAEGQLFGYQSIPAGMVYHMKVQADDEKDLQRINGWFGNQQLRLGRSRSAEYGSVQVVPVNARKTVAPKSIQDDLVALYLKSDLALTRDGMPVLVPVGEDFGLTGARLVPERSFLRSRRYSPWNAFFNCRMPERQVLCEGSVLTFKLAAPLDVATLQTGLESGVGMYREEGLGQIWVNPAWLWQAPKLKKWVAPRLAAASDPKTLLSSYLRDKSRQRAENMMAFKSGLEWAAEWKRLLHKIEKDGQKGPGKSQWANVRELAIRFRHDPAHFVAEFTNFCEGGLRSMLWVKAKTRSGGQDLNMRDAVLGRLGQTPTSRTVLTAYHAAVEMGRILSRSGAKQGE